MIQSRVLKSIFFLTSFWLLMTNTYLAVADAQAVFGVSGSAGTATKIGHTELLGSATFTVSSGTTVAGTIEFFIPNVAFTNSAATGITVTGTGGLAASTATVLPDSGIVIINVPAGALPGASITVSGVRISMVNQTFTTLDAAISTSGNSISSGQNSVRVLNSVKDGLVLDSTSVSTFSVVSGVVVNTPGPFVIREGWVQSFSSAVGVAGQTAKTQIIFQVTGLPDNVSLTFPNPVTGDNFATLVTLSGAPEVLTNQSPVNRVVYEFNDSAISPSLIDSFSITPTVGVSGTGGTGTTLIQVALGPIGAAVPNVQFPSTAIPRFAENFLPPASAVTGILATLFFPVPSLLTDQSLTISNTASGGAAITATARAEDGTLVAGISNQVGLSVAAGQTATFSLKNVFGSSASASSIAAIEIGSLNNKLVANNIGTIGSNRVGLAVPSQAAGTYLPFSRRTGAENPMLTLHNAGTADTTAQITLRSSSGSALASVSRTAKSYGTVRESFPSLFPSASVPLDGYLVISSSAPLQSLLLNNALSLPDEVPTLSGITNSPAIFPFFAFGGGYNSVLTLINPSGLSVRVTLNAYNSSGPALTSQPIVRTLGPSEEQNLDFGSLFSTGSAGGTTVGYFSLTFESSTTNPFFGAPAILGSIRFSTNTLASVVPLDGNVGTQFYMTPTVETASAYTGLAILNPSSAAAVTVTLSLSSGAGVVLGTVTFSLAPGADRIQLLRELIPQALSHDGGVLKISSSGNLRVLGFRGTLAQTELIYLRGETTP